MRGTTKQQDKVLSIIRNHVAERGYAPSVRDIAERAGLSSSSTVHVHLRNLEKKGLLRRDSLRARSLMVTEETGKGDVRTGSVPIVGRVAAGVPITAIENREGEFALDPKCVKDGTFMLRVKGDSMIDAHIQSDDLIVVHPGPDAENGDIVVALVDGEATVKRFYRERDRIRLQPENATMTPIYARDVTVVGKVGAVVRMIA